ncbi:hypothetical protein H8S37_04365 [Mediterraneibacter sp. NSJ-55]|uniref:Uncharacterized protein n=1 Tax=Mediterraneibacter hominis TaxID=2763054 RepID=A0A923LHD2_9FIRM|nr:hypothetical protein [Mediterraneibacter hominis]MBC5688167.1 hypothetical protein [Mediterraneibacter hominis]
MAITIQNIIDVLEKFHSKYKLSADKKSITFFFNNGDITRIEIGDDNKSIAVCGRIIGDLDELETWLYYNRG